MNKTIFAITDIQLWIQFVSPLTPVTAEFNWMVETNKERGRELNAVELQLPRVTLSQVSLQSNDSNPFNHTDGHDGH